MYEDIDLILNLSVYNLLDQQNEVSVNNNTGRAYTAIIQDTDLSSHRSNFNSYEDRIQNPAMYSTPRLIKLAMSVNF